MGDAGTSDLPSAYSTLANSQIESNEEEVREKARENAKTACELIEEELGGYREKLDNGTIGIDAFVDEILAVDERAGVAAGKQHEDRVKGYAWALYFYGRVLAGGDKLAKANAAATEGGSGSTRDDDDLKKARKYELAALKIRRRVYNQGMMLFAYNCDSLAVVCEALDDLEDAKVFSEEAWALQQKRHGDETGSIEANYERIKKKCSAVSEAL